MRQLQQNFSSGELELVEVPEPRLSSNGVLIDTQYSLVSAGTERAMMELANKTLIGKAKERPDLVKEVINKARNDGLRSTYHSVQSRLDKPLPLGYSCSGRVVEVGKGVSEFSTGDLVACGGAGYATHAELNHVPVNLCTSLPENVSPRDGAFTTVGAIAMQGIRRLEPTPGDRIAVIGLGLVGRLTTKLLSAYGHPVLGIDIDPSQVAEADELDAKAIIGENDVEQVARSFGQGGGVDGVIITAATDSDQPVEMAGSIVRERGRISAVGDVGMDIPRTEYYEKELDFRLSRSYGPGRYDRIYEEDGLDYPISYVRWTENRNMAEFLRLVGDDRVELDDLVSHTYPFDDALEAYDLILEGVDYSGVVLQYEQACDHRESRINLRSVSKNKVSGTISVGVIGAGNFATSTLLPTISKIDDLSIRAVATATGGSAKAVGKKYGAKYVTTDYEEVIADEGVDLVVIATRHNLHAEITVAALDAGKNVHVEKPPALNREELQSVVKAEQSSLGRLMVGYNRRFSEPAQEIADSLSPDAPLMANYRINVGSLPLDSWVLNPEEGGGRIIGEICHFVDLLQFFTGARPESVYAVGPSVPRDSPTRQNVQAVIEFCDGSTGVITYTNIGNDSVGKEYIEIASGGQLNTIDDFKTGRLGLGQDKGFQSEFQALRNAIHEDSASPISLEEIISTSCATFAIKQSLQEGEPRLVGSIEWK